MSILDRIFPRRPGDAPETELLSRFDMRAERRVREMAESTSAERAAEMLRAPAALFQLTPDESRLVVSYMRPKRVSRGTTFIREGDAEKTGYMVLVLDGEVTVESIVVSRTHPITVTVLGPGSLVGEMGLVDGSPRSASCTAITDLRCGVLTREGLNKLLDHDPRTAAKLMMAVSRRMSDRLREGQVKLKTYAQLTQAMQEEIRSMPA